MSSIRLSFLGVALLFITFALSLPAWASNVVLRDLSFRANGNIVDNTDLYNEVKSKYIGNPIDAYLLQSILNEVTQYYRKNGYPSSRAYLPEQTIDQNGIVNIEIIYTQIGNINLIFKDRLKINNGKANKVFSALRELERANLHNSKLESELLKLSDLKVFDVEAQMANSINGQDVAISDIDVTLKPLPRVTGQILADNHGSESTGEYRLSAYATVNNLTHNLDSLSFFAATTDESQLNFSLNYEIPISSALTTIGGGLCYSNYELSEEFSDLEAQGDSLTAELYLRQPLFRSLKNRTDAYLGYRYRKLSDEIGLFDIEFKKHSHALYASLQSTELINYDLSLFGDVKATFGQVYSDDEYDLVNDKAFMIFNLRGGLDYKFNDTWATFAKAEAQFANTQLDASEYFSIAGADAIAGFKSNKASADEGALLCLGLNIKPFYAHNFIVSPHLQAGYVAYKGIDLRQTLTSTGLDLIYSLEGLFAKLQLDIPLSKKDIDDDSFILWASLGYRF